MADSAIASNGHKKASRMKSEDRREQILEAALHVFARENYHGATTAKIAGAAGITEPVIYQHFKSKRELFLEVLKRCRKDMIEWNASVLARHDDPIERYQAFTDMFKYYTTQFNRDSAMMWAVAATVNDPDIKAEIRDTDDAVLEQLTSDIWGSMERGKVSSRHAPQVLARIIHGINSHLSWLILVGESGTQDWVYEDLKRFIADVMRKD